MVDDTIVFVSTHSNIVSCFLRRHKKTRTTRTVTMTALRYSRARSADVFPAFCVRSKTFYRVLLAQVCRFCVAAFCFRVQKALVCGDTHHTGFFKNCVLYAFGGLLRPQEGKNPSARLIEPIPTNASSGKNALSQDLISTS